MAFEFHLVRHGHFSPAILNAMREWWSVHPIAVAPDGTLLIFPDDETRTRRRADHAAEPTRNDYLTSQVHLDPTVVTLSVTGERLPTRWLVEFVEHAERRWAAELRYCGERASGSDIMAVRDSA